MSRFARVAPPALVPVIDVVRKLCLVGVDFGYQFNVDNGQGEILAAPSDNWRSLVNACNHTGGDTINVYRHGEYVGALMVEWVNGADHCIADYSVSLEEFVTDLLG